MGTRQLYAVWCRDTERGGDGLGAGVGAGIHCNSTCDGSPECSIQFFFFLLVVSLPGFSGDFGELSMTDQTSSCSLFSKCQSVGLSLSRHCSIACCACIVQ